PVAGQYIFQIGVQSGWNGAISGDADFHIVKNGSEIYSEFLPPNSATTFSNRLNLASGDVVDFVGGPGADGSEYASNLKFSSQITLNASNAPPPAVVVYDLSRDWSSTANPNGPWSFGWESVLGGDFGLLPYTKGFFSDNGVPLLSW